ncbi:MAG: hypothetical protein EZS28_002012, partial [Streblomastix strix]
GIEENSQAISITENTNTNSTYSGHLKQDNRRTKQVKYPGRLFSKEREIHSFVLSVAVNTYTELVRYRRKQTRRQIRGNRRGKGRGRMVENIFQTMDGGDLLDPPPHSKDWKNPDRLGKVQIKVNHYGTLVARSNMVHTLTNKQQRIHYSWRKLSDSEPGEGHVEKVGHATVRKNRSIPHGPRVDQWRKLLTEFLNNINITKKTQQMIIEGQKYYIQKKYMQIMVVYDDWMKENNYTIENIMNYKIPFKRTEFMTWLSRTRKTKPSSANHFINNPRFGSTWDINQLFEHWGERPESNILSNEELQIKQASLLMSLLFVRMEEMANIDLSVSILDDQKQRAAVCFPPKQSKKRQRYDVRRTENPKVCPTETFFVWFPRHREHFQQRPTNFIHLFWTENWMHAYQRYISTRLKRLVLTLGVQNANANSNGLAASTELAAHRFDGRTINCFTHHTSDSKMNNRFYVFAVNKEQDFIASALVKNHGENQAIQIISKQRGGVRLFPQENLASPLSLPIISSQPIVEAESPNDHESAQAQNSQKQKDEQDVDPQEEAQNSSLTKDSDRATTAGAQK